MRIVYTSQRKNKYSTLKKKGGVEIMIIRTAKGKLTVVMTSSSVPADMFGMKVNLMYFLKDTVLLPSKLMFSILMFTLWYT